MKHLSIFLIFALGSIGCPPPFWQDLRFYDGQATKKKYRLKLAEDNCYLTITARKMYRNKNSFKLRIEAQYRDGSAADFEFRPNALKLLINEEEWPYPSTDEVHRPRANERKEYIVPFPISNSVSYDFLMEDERLVVDEKTGQYFVAKLEIVLENFIFYKNEPLPIDTIKICCVR